MISGLEKAIQKLQEGAHAMITLTPLLGYGDVGMPAKGVPPRAHLVYEIILVRIHAGTDQSVVEGFGHRASDQSPIPNTNNNNQGKDDALLAAAAASMGM